MLEPGVQVILHLQPLQVDRTVGVSTARFALGPTVPGQHAVGPLEVLNERRPGYNLAAHGPSDAHRAGLSVVADDHDEVLVNFDGHADAELLAIKAAFTGPPVALREICAVNVGLVNPDGVAQHDPVPVAGYCGEHAVLPFVGGLEGDAARLGHELDRDVTA